MPNEVLEAPSFILDLESSVRLQNEIITPAIAKVRLRTMRGDTTLTQRSLDPGKVARYERAMIEGRWRANAETLKIDQDGIPIDGQHRYEAGVRSDVPFPAAVAYGVARETLSTIDQGKSRSAADVLKMHGHEYTSEQAVAVSWLARLDTGYAYRSVDMAADETLFFVEDNPDLVDSVKVTHLTRKMGISAGMLAAAHYRFKSKDPVAADNFFYDLRVGEALQAGDPVLVLRNFIIDDRIKLKGKRAKHEEILARIIRAWNLRRRGERINPKNLQGTRVDEENRYPWPEIR